jgi:hypothetical protein
MEKIKSAIYLLEEANRNLDQNEFYDWVQDKIKSLKELEKQQIVVANRAGWMQGFRLTNILNSPLDSEQYYNQTYVSDINVGNM